MAALPGWWETVVTGSRDPGELDRSVVAALANPELKAGAQRIAHLLSVRLLVAG